MMTNFTKFTTCLALLTILASCASNELKQHTWVKIYMEYDDGTRITDYDGYGHEVNWEFTDQSIEEWVDGRINWRLPYKLTSNGKVIKIDDDLNFEIVQLDESCLRLRQFDERSNQYYYTFFQSNSAYNPTTQFTNEFEQSYEEAVKEIYGE